MARGEFQLGSWAWGPAWGSAVVKYASAADNLQAKADGIDGARQTFRGRDLTHISVTLQWREDKAADGSPGPIDLYATRFLTAISPVGTKAGKPWAWVEQDQGIHGVNNVTVDKSDTVYPPSTGMGTATLALTSWTKPAVRPAVTATPSTPNPWSPSGATQPTSPPTGFATTPVEVKP